MRSLLLAPALVLLFALAGPAAAEDIIFNGTRAHVARTIPSVGKVVLPQSSIQRPADRGLYARTHLHILKREVAPPHAAQPMLSKIETPASIACLYGLARNSAGCNPDQVASVATGGSRMIAIVDAFHNKTVLKDLKVFSQYFGLPAPKLEVIYCSPSKCGVATPPPADEGWASEIALDTQWAHALAPNARILLVEAASNKFADLMVAVAYAATRVAAAGGGQVSMSWGGAEFEEQTSYDRHFKNPKVAFFASTGDHLDGSGAPDVNWPSTSPYVIAVGGTTVVRKNDGSFLSETAWPDTGGGLSLVYGRPPFQNRIASEVGAWRGVPDVSTNADPISGVYVYCSAGTCGFSGGWFTFGGTSFSAVAMAAMTNSAGRFRNTRAQQQALYERLSGPLITDIIRGRCGNGSAGHQVPAETGWDRCTGVGSPKTPGAL